MEQMEVWNQFLNKNVRLIINVYLEKIDYNHVLLKFKIYSPSSILHFFSILFLRDEMFGHFESLIDYFIRKQEIIIEKKFKNIKETKRYFYNLKLGEDKKNRTRAEKQLCNGREYLKQYMVEHKFLNDSIRDIDSDEGTKYILKIMNYLGINTYHQLYDIKCTKKLYKITDIQSYRTNYVNKKFKKLYGGVDVMGSQIGGIDNISKFIGICRDIIQKKEFFE